MLNLFGIRLCTVIDDMFPDQQFDVLITRDGDVIANGMVTNRNVSGFTLIPLEILPNITNPILNRDCFTPNDLFLSMIMAISKYGILTIDTISSNDWDINVICDVNGVKYQAASRTVEYAIASLLLHMHAEGVVKDEDIALSPYLYTKYTTP